jgi:ribosome biogenesis GTPase / thiamine phosphate phosphatase
MSPTPDMGWNEERAQQLLELRERWPDAFAGRVARVEAAVATCWTERGSIIAHLPSKLRVPEGRPAVGDWAVLRPGEQPRIEALLPRATQFVRRAAGRRVLKQVVAANVDVMFLVSSLDGDFNPRRLERYLTAARDGGARPVILLTKAGLCADVAAELAVARSAAPDVPVHAMDVIDGIDAAAAHDYLRPGITAGLVGSSGVGKSTLINHWLGEDRQATGEVRAGDRKGVHTTTARELFRLPSGALVIDTPGMRELALWADDDALDEAFADVEALSQRCRFANCRHAAEPGCAVRAAMEEGVIDAARVSSYLALRRELEQHGRRRFR